MCGLLCLFLFHPIVLGVQFTRMVLFRYFVCNVDLVVFVLNLVVKESLQNQSLGKVKFFQLLHVFHELVVLDTLHKLVMENTLPLGPIAMVKRVYDT